MFYSTLVVVGTSAFEIVQVTAVSTDTFTIVRGQQNTSAIAFSAGDLVELRITAADANSWGVSSSITAQLAASTGASLVGYTQPATGAAYRTALSKLSDRIDWADFYQSGDTDDTAALNRAVAAGVTRLNFSGPKNIGGTVIFTSPFILTGNGRGSQINFTNLGAWFEVLGTQASVAQGIEFEYLTLSANGYETAPHFFANWAKQIKFSHCFIYHCPMSFNHMNFWNITDCEVYNSQINVYYTRDLGEPNQVSGAPRITAGFFSASPIVLQDCVDLQIVNSHFFQNGISSRLVNWVNDGSSPAAQKPKSTFLITNSFFDSIDGLAWDFWDVGLSSFTNNFISAGRTLGLDGAYFYRGWHNNFVGNIFNYCGSYGLALELCEKNRIIGSDFIGNKAGGLQTVGNCANIQITNNAFGNTPTVFGGAYTQPIGYVDYGSTGTGIRFTGNDFTLNDMAQNIDLTVSLANRNYIYGNEGVTNVVVKDLNGPTAYRPTGVQSGYQFYDATLGLPIWCAGNNVWKNAAGVTV